MKKSLLLFIIFGVGLFAFPPSVAAYTPVVCDANLNDGSVTTPHPSDQIVDLTDYGLLLNDFFSTQPSNPKADINRDGIVDVSDYSWMINFFFQTCSTPTPTPISGAVNINPGGNEPSSYVADIMNSKGAGTTFYFKKGVHRINGSLPFQNGDKLMGEKGAIISGARLFNNSTVKRDGELYYFDNQTQQSEPKPNGTYRGEVGQSASGTGYVCIATHVRCVFNEELFINDKLLRHVESKDKVGAGDFFFDYDANRIYFRDDPTGKRVEASVTLLAAANILENNVVISNLIFEKFATPAQRAAVEANGENNLVEFNEFRWNHGAGVTIGSKGKLKNNFIHRNGHKGFGSGQNAVDVLVERNEIAYNTTAGFEPGWDAGANKFAVTTRATFRQNYSHHNIGPGFWTDIDNMDSVYDGNKVEYNKGQGIQHEISFNAIIKNNYVAYNDKNQIFIQNSGGINGGFVEVFNNTVIIGPNSQHGIVAQNEPRGYSKTYPIGTCRDPKSEHCEPWVARNIKVYNNKLYYLRTDDKGVIAGLYGRDRNNGGTDPHTFQWAAPTTKFYNNTYYINNNSLAVWNWGPYWTKMTLNTFNDSQTGETLPTQSLPTMSGVQFTWSYPVGPQ